MGSTTINIGDTVKVDKTFIVRSYDESTLRIEIEKGIITIPRFISALGQFLPGYNWILPGANATLEEYFYLNGRYTRDDKLYIAAQYSQIELDQKLNDFVDQEADGSILWGKVVFIYAIYQVDSVFEHVPEDIEYYETSLEAQHDFYAYEIYVVIQDQGTSIEYPINLKHLSKMYKM